ncbi:MAG: hypothetical protein NUV80_05575 [Candidatus Berkelbacteria bacterium]|nr:hypothetical protein [Candidatus Berkelbacteria bacterium]
MLNNKYVFQPYWEYQSGRLSKEDWLMAFERSNNSANRALGRTDTTRVLAEIFDRLYTLRNQLIHGGATWNSGINRSQIKDGANILGFLVPTIIHLMMENHDVVWGEPCYPVVD